MNWERPIGQLLLLLNTRTIWLALLRNLDYPLSGWTGFGNYLVLMNTHHPLQAGLPIASTQTLSASDRCTAGSQTSANAYQV